MWNSKIRCASILLAVCALSPALFAAETASTELRVSIEKAVNAVRPALVRIHVVEVYYREGRELKYEISGSGSVITEAGHIITNSHVVGHAKQIKCVFANKEEIAAELVGTDPLTDIAVILLKPDTPRKFPVVVFGDSDKVVVGDHVLAMGSPLALSQSVTLGIVSNSEMILPESMRRRGGIRQDGEDVGALVRWLGHDAAIYGGNSGGPLVNLDGEMIGINEIGLGLAGAIPGNLAKEVAEQLIKDGKVRRAWLGIEVQQLLKHGASKRGILVSGALEDSPAEAAGLASGDILLKIGDTEVDARFAVQLPDFNGLVAALPIGEKVSLLIDRDGERKQLEITPVEREPREPEQFEFKQWGITVRNISLMQAKEMKRDNTDGVLVTSVRPGGPAGSAKPAVARGDVIVAVGGKPVENAQRLRKLTAEITKDSAEPVPVLTNFERKTGKFLSAVKVGIKELQDPGLEVKKAWLPIETQVITRDIAELLGDSALSGFRVTRVFENSTAAEAGVQVGDLILAVDDEPMTAKSPEHYEELATLIRQYRVDKEVALKIRRNGEDLETPVKLVLAPKSSSEMKKYSDEQFEFTVRDITFIDKATEQWDAAQHGVLVQQVKSGGWAALGRMSVGDLIVAIDGENIDDVQVLRTKMRAIASGRAEVVLIKVLRGIHTVFIELEPKWAAA